MRRRYVVPTEGPDKSEGVVAAIKEYLGRPANGDSRLVMLHGGRVMPILSLLAHEKFGNVDQIFHPCWKDGNPDNEAWTNVGLCFYDRQDTREKKSGISAKAGTNEYARELYHRKKKQREEEKQVVQEVLQDVDAEALSPELLERMKRINAAAVETGQPKPFPNVD